MKWIPLTALIAWVPIGFAADLPVKQVILYKHGVGYFLRSGQVDQGQSARLEFKAAEMDDVLKSLTIEDRGGAKVSGVRYDSSEPLERRLSEFPFHLTEGQPLAAILDQLKGARVELKLGSEALAGVIVGGRVVPAVERNPEREQVSLLLDSSELRTIDLASAASVKFADAKLQAQFKAYLATLADARSKEKRSLYIDSTESKARQLLVSYMLPAPVWKTSYRMIFGEGEQPTFEGWAIVDNTTGEDWLGIQLSLVSGKPISFVSRLYEPRYAARPVAELPDQQAQAPVVYEGAMEERGDRATRKAASGGGAIGGMLGVAPAAAPAPPPAPMMMRMGGNVSSVAVATEARELGDLFEYRIATPVTVRKGESAMLPLLQQKTGARKLLVYSDPSAMNPMSAAEVTNSTGKTLDGGPITVYEAEAYAGEALVATLKAGEKRLISYAVDLGTRITTNLDSRVDTVREVHLKRGVLSTRTAAVETKTYTIRNVDQKPKTLVIEHPVREGFHLMNQKPVETTSSAHRFEVKLAPGASEKFPVTEERVYETSMAVSNVTPDIVVLYATNKALTDSGRKQLEQILEQKRKIAEAVREIRQTEKRAEALVRDQERMRKNIESLNQVSGQQQQVQNYARQLAGQESELAALRDRLAELEKQRAALESDLNALIEKLEF